VEEPHPTKSNDAEKFRGKKKKNPHHQERRYPTQIQKKKRTPTPQQVTSIPKLNGLGKNEKSLEFEDVKKSFTSTHSTFAEIMVPSTFRNHKHPILSTSPYLCLIVRVEACAGCFLPLLSKLLLSCLPTSLSSPVPPSQTLGVLFFPLSPPSRKGATHNQKILAPQLASKAELPPHV
jgi:hypothetical protein